MKTGDYRNQSELNFDTIENDEGKKGLLYSSGIPRRTTDFISEVWLARKVAGGCEE
jgi:hypothetical protein